MCGYHLALTSPDAFCNAQALFYTGHLCSRFSPSSQWFGAQRKSASGPCQLRLFPDSSMPPDWPQCFPFVPAWCGVPFLLQTIFSLEIISPDLLTSPYLNKNETYILRQLLILSHDPSPRKIFLKRANCQKLTAWAEQRDGVLDALSTNNIRKHLLGACGKLLWLGDSNLPPQQHDERTSGWGIGVRWEECYEILNGSEITPCGQYYSGAREGL